MVMGNVPLLRGTTMKYTEDAELPGTVMLCLALSPPAAHKPSEGNISTVTYSNHTYFRVGKDTNHNHMNKLETQR